MSELIVEDREHGRWIIFNRPAQLNTLMVDDLIAARDAVLEAAAAGRSIAFTGAGERAFCAGMNLDVFADLLDDPSRTRTQLGALREMLDAVRTAEVVTIAAINGHCLGAAFELALACDFRIARPRALLGLPEIKLGLPCILDSALLQQYVGLAFAKEMILTGRLYPAERLAPTGIVTVLEEGAELTDEVDALLAEFADTSRVALASQKRIFDAWQNLPLHEANERSLDEITRVFEDDTTRRTLSDYTARLKSRERTAPS